MEALLYKLTMVGTLNGNLISLGILFILTAILVILIMVGDLYKAAGKKEAIKLAMFKAKLYIFLMIVSYMGWGFWVAYRASEHVLIN